MREKELSNDDNRKEVKDNAIRIINECIENDESFILYSSKNDDLISVCQKDLPIIIGSLFTNLMSVNDDDNNMGMSKKDLLKLLDISENVKNKEKNKKDEENKNKDDISSINDYLIKVLDDLKKKIDKETDKGE